MQKRDLPRHIEKMRLLYLDIWGVIFMCPPLTLLFITLTKYIEYGYYILTIGMAINVFCYLNVAEFPKFRQRGFDVMCGYLKYHWYGDRELRKDKKEDENKEEVISEKKFNKLYS